MTEIEQKHFKNLLEIINKKIEVYEYSRGESLVLSNGMCIMITKNIYHANKLNIKIPSTKGLGDESYYDFKDSIAKKTFKIDSNLFKNIDKWLTSLTKGKTNGSGILYLLTDGKYTKIGVTGGELNDRILKLQTGNALKLKPIGFYNVSHMINTENYLHNKFKHKNILNEWFELSYEDISEILTSKHDIKTKSNSIILNNIDIQKINETINSINYYFNEIIEKSKQRNYNRVYFSVKNYIDNLPYCDKIWLKKSMVNKI